MISKEEDFLYDRKEQDFQEKINQKNLEIMTLNADINQLKSQLYTREEFYEKNILQNENRIKQHIEKIRRLEQFNLDEYNQLV